MLKKLCLVTTLLLFVGGCHDNPYSGVSGRLLPKPVQQKPGGGGGDDSGFVLDVPPEVDVTETQNTTATITATVDTGNPQVDFGTLPSWITYNNGTMTFAPQVGDAADPADPSATVRSYQIHVTLTSSTNQISKKSATIVVLVHKLASAPAGPVGAGGLTVTYADTTAQILEGQTYSGQIKVTSTTNPQGPFIVSAIGLQSGVTIASTSDPTVFSITYTPSYSTVTNQNHYTYCTDSAFNQHLCSSTQWNLVVVDPGNGGKVATSVNWDILDVRQNAQVVADTQVKSVNNGVAEFDVYVSDPNGEAAPQVTAQQPNFGSGNVTLTVAAQGPASPTPGVNPYVLEHVVWSGTPSSFQGTQQSLTINSCVYDEYAYYGWCATQTINVQF